MIEKMKLKVQPKFKDYKYILLFIDGGMTQFKYAKSMKEVKALRLERLNKRGMKLHVFKGNHDFIEGYVFK